VTTATFGAGCFWGVEETFRTTKGVTKTTVGYAGGKTKNPTYEDVCSDETGHAEVVQVEFDPKQVSYKELLELFWDNHDPTQKDRQGPDVGTQYRSVIFYHGAEQKKDAEQSMKDRQPKHKKPIATKISPAPPFYPAESYHHQYLAKRGQSSCHF
jgi:peptide-methionine (S)-S-oxide reductase